MARGLFSKENAMANTDEVRVVIDGKEFKGWEGVTIEMAVDHIADAFSITAPWDPGRKELREAFRPFGYQKAELFIDDEKLLTGRIDKVTPSLEAKDRRANLQGRSLTGVLADCSHDGDLEFGNNALTLADIARQVCKPFKVAVRADNDTATIQEVRAEYGQVAADFLNSIAAPRNILLNCSYDGELVLTWGATLLNKMPGARLVEGQYPVESVDSDFDSTKRFSVFKAATQFAGQNFLDISYDSTIRVYRPHLSAVQDTDASPEDVVASTVFENDIAGQRGQSFAGATAKSPKSHAAARARAASLAESISVNVSVTGWRRPDGKRWAERQVVTLLAPSAMVYKEAAWLIAGVTLKLDASGGRSTSLRLVLPETYSGTMPKVIPWLD
jgi:prophage tail gpP-like protein